MTSDEWSKWVRETSSKAEEMLVLDHKILYIKLLRSLTGRGLRDCKDMTEALQMERRRAQMREAAKLVLRGELSENAYNYIETLIDG